MMTETMSAFELSSGTGCRFCGFDVLPLFSDGGPCMLCVPDDGTGAGAQAKVPVRTRPRLWMPSGDVSTSPRSGNTVS